VPRGQHHPTPEERDERVKLDLPPDEAIRLVMETGNPLPGHFQIVNPAGCPHWSPPEAAPGGVPQKGARATCQACLRMGRSDAEATGTIDSIWT
jgi:hypothetical protein